MIDDGRQAIIDIAYLIAAVFFIFGLKFLSSPRKARRGNQLSALGMGLAILATFLSRDWESGNYILIVVGILIGGVAAGWAARVVKMTAMPQMTAIYNGMGGATAALVSLGEFPQKQRRHWRKVGDHHRLHDRLYLLHRVFGRFRQIAGIATWQTNPHRQPADVFGDWRIGHRRPDVPDADSRSRHFDEVDPLADLRNRAGPRSITGPADWWRRYAGGDRRLQLAHRVGGGSRRSRARQPGDGYRGSIGRGDRHIILYDPAGAGSTSCTPPTRTPTAAGGPARVPSSTCAPTGCAPRVDLRRRRRAVRSWPGWSATTRSPPAGSTTPCGSPCPAPATATSGRPGTPPPTRRTPRCRRWACACA